MKIAQYAGALLLGSALLTGCMSTKPDQSNYSGWMTDYSDLTEFKTATGGTSMRWISPSLKKGQYNAVMIDPIAYYPAPPADSQVPQKTINALPTYLMQQLRNNLGSEIQIVQKPGPGVLRLRSAITGVDTPTEGLKVYEVIPVALIFAGVSTATGHRDHNTLVYMEMQLIDSQSGDLLAKGVRKGIGENIANDKAEMTLDDAKPVLNNWAKDAAVFAKTFVK
jgi:hypothetical protein